MSWLLSAAWAQCLGFSLVPLPQLTQPAVATAAVATAAAERKDVLLFLPSPAGLKPGQSIRWPEYPQNQVVEPSLAGGGDKPQLAVLVPKWKADLNLQPPANAEVIPAQKPVFEWKENQGRPQLQRQGKPVAELMNTKHDPSTPLSHYLTFKVFHHVYDLADGQNLLTAGAHDKSEKMDKDGKKVDRWLFPHHRGLFYGFNRISYEGKQADVWHGTKNEFVSYERTLTQDAGPLLGRHCIQINWHGQDGKPFAEEKRELAILQLGAGRQFDFTSVLTTKLPQVRLDGDPQHAGFHFRANQEVAQKTAKETFYIRPDGKGKPGEFRNWEPKGKKGPVNQPWDALSFVLQGKRYTALYLNHPANPNESRHSERDYGRFGCYFEYDLTPTKPLLIRYRLWIQEGEMSVEDCQSKYDAFTFDVRKGS